MRSDLQAKSGGLGFLFSQGPVFQTAAILMASLGLGALFAFAFPSHALAALGPICLGGLFALLVACGTVRRAAAIGFAFGFGQFAINLSWIANAFAVREGFTYSQGVASSLLLAAVMGIFIAIACAVARWFMNRAGRPHGPLLFAGAWLAQELVRSFIFTGFPWNPVGAIWGPYALFAQLASAVGVFGLSFVTVLISALITNAVLIKVGRLSGSTRVPPIGNPGGNVLAAAVLLGMQLAYGFWALPDGPADVDVLTQVHLVQANIAQERKWRSDLLEDHLQRHVDLSAAALDSVRPGTADRTAGKDGNTPQVASQIVIWPETAYPYFIDRDAREQKWLQAAAAPGATLIFGANRIIDRPDGRTARNAMFVLNGGELTARYDKAHLVPFGEYLPFASLLRALGMNAFVDEMSGFSQGVDEAVLAPGPVPPLLAMICYEGIFPQAAEKLTTPGGQRAQWLLNISNDGWFGLSHGPVQHLNLARFRALETGLPLVRSTGTGISAIFDPYGRIVDAIALGTQSVLSGHLPEPLPPRIYAVFGLKGLAIVCGLSLILPLLVARRSLKAPPNPLKT